jgi:hypothetical protein
MRENIARIDGKQINSLSGQERKRTIRRERWGDVRQPDGADRALQEEPHGGHLRQSCVNPDSSAPNFLGLSDPDPERSFRSGSYLFYVIFTVILANLHFKLDHIRTRLDYIGTSKLP